MLTLFEQLMENVSNNESFFFKDRVLENTTYRIFSYRLANYSSFLLPQALEMRGITFRKEEDNWVLVCRPMEKFFNLNENPMTMNLDLSQIKSFQLKEDGSLISSYLHNGTLFLKSKTALFSRHAQKSTAWLNLLPSLKEEIFSLTKDGYTVNLEWCSPEFGEKIVVNYDKPCLKLLNIRNVETGEYLQDISKFPELTKILADILPSSSPEDFVSSIKDMKNIEGYVATLNNGLKIKIKTDWYLSLHRLRDDIDNPKKLFCACLNGAIDDMKSLFFQSPEILERLNKIENKVFESYNHFMRELQTIYEDNKDKSQKDLAIFLQKDYPKFYLPPIMSLKNGKHMDTKEYIIKNYDTFLDHFYLRDLLFSIPKQEIEE